MPRNPQPDPRAAALEENLRLLEGQLRQAQKMETLGQLAGGIAHDFNNLLTVITGCAQVLLDELPAGNTLRIEADEILGASQRAAALTNQLLRFSRKQPAKPTVLEVDSLVTNLESMLRRVLGEQIELIIELNAAGAKIEADVARIEQALINLAVNARDAMPEGGTLRLETGFTVRDEDSGSPRRFVMLAVGDTGCGMSEEVRARLFEPFFTTKETGRGTGLGLWTVYNIVQEFGGDIWVSSNLGQGTTFRIYLPETAREPEAKAAPTRPGALTGHAETVLLVEDEDRVRKLVGGMLTRLGYRVISAPGGREAIRLARESEGQIHMLLTDVVMPQMSGHELAGRLTSMLPGVSVVYMSGYVQDSLVHRDVVSSGAPFLQKPFTQDALARLVRAVLDRGIARARQA
jgi:nitrogen-specific signal transduction histidine kinase/ActR/RegA family two-component response regulator